MKAWYGREDLNIRPSDPYPNHMVGILVGKRVNTSDDERACNRALFGLAAAGWIRAVLHWRSARMNGELEPRAIRREEPLVSLGPHGRLHATDAPVPAEAALQAIGTTVLDNWSLP